MPFFSGVYMDNLCDCLECNRLVDESDMRDTTGKLCYHSSVCSDCYEKLEGDDYE